MFYLFFQSVFGSDIYFFFFFFNDTATTEIYTLSLHDALPIYQRPAQTAHFGPRHCPQRVADRSEEHTSELQSLAYLVCRLLLEKKKKKHLYLSQTKKIKTNRNTKEQKRTQ